jgi:hypothetical protein
MAWITWKYDLLDIPKEQADFGTDMNVRFSLENLKAFNREEDAVMLPDGSGYLGTLNVYHEIHCVVRNV